MYGINKITKKGLDYGDDDPAMEIERKKAQANIVSVKDNTKPASKVDNLIDSLFGPPKPKPKPIVKPADTTTTQTQPAKPQPVTAPVVNPPAVNPPGNKGQSTITQQPQQQTQPPKVVVNPAPVPATQTITTPSRPTPPPNKVQPPKPEPKKPEVVPSTQPNKGDGNKTGGSPPKNDRHRTPAYIAPPEGVSGFQIVHQRNNQAVFNRPAYIRKLKKVSEDYDYRSRNEKCNQVEGVKRLSTCYLREVRKDARSGFTDSQFPPNFTAFTDNFKGKERKDQVKDLAAWKTPTQVYKNPTVGQYIDPNDVASGFFNTEYLASCLASLAENDKNIKRLIQEQTLTSTGFYYVRINVGGVWRYIAVDHWIPVNNEGRILTSHSYPDEQSDLWPFLIEKAYTKAFGTFGIYNHPQSREAYLRDLTGAPVTVHLAEASIFERFQSYLLYGYVVQAVPKSNIEDYGLNPNITLNVVKSDPNKKTIQIRNSFGTIKDKARVTISKEGVFQASLDDLKSYISHFLVAEIHDNYYTSTIQARHKDSYYSSYSFIIKHNFKGYVMVSQMDPRLYNVAVDQYEVSPIRVVVSSRDGPFHRVITSGYVNAKNMDLELELTPGEYIVHIITSWTDKDHDLNLSIYGSSLINLSRVYHKKYPALLAEGLEPLALRDGNQTVRNGVEEYTYVHQPTGLIVISNFNTSQRSVRHTKDMTKVKGQELALITEKSQFEKLSGKSGAFEERQWSLDLEPEEKFSWVIASKEQLGPDHLRAYGFV